MRNPTLPLTLALAAAFASPSGPARADLMTACASAISQYCSNVTQGRGRVSACLAGHMGQLGASCRTEVQAVGRSRLTPGYVRPVFDPAFRLPLPQACEAAAAQFCPGMTPGEGRVFACLYAYSDRVGRTCTNAAEAALKAN